MLESDTPESTSSDSTSSDPSGAGTQQPAGQQPAGQQPAAPRKRAPRKAAAKAGPPPAADPPPPADAAVSEPPAAPRKRTARKAAAATAPGPSAEGSEAASPPAKKAARKATAKKTTAKKAAADPSTEPAKAARKRASKKAAATEPPADTAADVGTSEDSAAAAMAAPGVLFMAPAAEAPKRRRPAKKAAAPAPDTESDTGAPEPAAAGADVTTAEGEQDATAEPDDVREAAIEQASGARRRRRRGRRGRGGAKADGAEGGDADSADTPDDESADTATTEDDPAADTADAADAAEEGGGSTARRRRRRRSGGSDGDAPADDPPNTVTHVREPKKSDDGVRGVKGSTRLEAKRQRRRDGRDTTRRRAPILTESEFLARREAVDRVMAVRQNGERTQIAVLEDDMLVEHYVTRASATSYVGNVYLGRVQNVLPSMEAAFIDIGKGRNGVLYAGEVNWDAAGLEGKSRAIEQALKSGDSVLVQVTKDPISHKGARLTSQISLPGRFLVLVPGGGMTGISRRLPDTERHRLKAILKKIVPEEAGVIVRTAAEGASEEDLTRDVERLNAQWQAIEEAAGKNGGKSGSAPVLLHGEPDLAIRVVRDVFNEDFNSLVVQGEDAWQTVSDYLGGVAPDLAERASKYVGNGDVFHDLRVDEQLMKALDRKVWLPSGGSLVIDRTEAMTVIDVNTGKFVGSGGNLEQTVTRNNLEAAEEIVRQLRLRDVGGMLVIDFIDMVLESNRELVLRRLTECLGRDRTKHQVAEVTSLGLVQMTRKRVGEGLLEAFSETCEHCNGRGVILHSEPIDKSNGSTAADDDGARPKQGKRKRGGRGGAGAAEPAEPVEPVEPPASDEQRKAAASAIAAIHRAANGDKEDDDDAAGLVDELASGLVAAAMDAESGTPVEASIPEPALEPAAQVAADLIESVARTENGAAPAPAAPQRRRRRAASRPAGPPVSA